VVTQEKYVALEKKVSIPTKSEGHTVPCCPEFKPGGLPEQPLLKGPLGAGAPSADLPCPLFLYHLYSLSLA
jgi:hypothetical protein